MVSHLPPTAKWGITRWGILLGTAAIAAACPVCNTETGQQVREGIFGEGFVQNVFAVAAPIPILLGMALALSHWLGKEEPRV